MYYLYASQTINIKSKTCLLFLTNNKHFLAQSKPVWLVPISTYLTRVVVWIFGRVMFILPPWAWCVLGLVWIRSGAVRMDTCCWRPPAMLPLLVSTKESVSGCSCVISFLFRFPITSTLCWLYKICKHTGGKLGSCDLRQHRYTAWISFAHTHRSLSSLSNAHMWKKKKAKTVWS